VSCTRSENASLNAFQRADWHANTGAIESKRKQDGLNFNVDAELSERRQQLQKVQLGRKEEEEARRAEGWRGLQFLMLFGRGTSRGATQRCGMTLFIAIAGLLSPWQGWLSGLPRSSAPISHVSLLIPPPRPPPPPLTKRRRASPFCLALLCLHPSRGWFGSLACKHILTVSVPVICSLHEPARCAIS
jgi:hypothetical protein